MAETQVCLFLSERRIRSRVAVGSADADSKVPSVETPRLTNVLLLKPGIGQNIDTLASPTVRYFCLVLVLFSRSMHLNIKKY